MNHRDTEAQRNHLNDLTRKIIGMCIEIHRELGPGLLESAYEECLAYELSQNGLHFGRQRPLPIRYKPLGLLVNFNVPVLKQGIKRIVCGNLFRSEGLSGMGVVPQSCFPSPSLPSSIERSEM